jgi:hypothetical protein
VAGFQLILITDGALRTATLNLSLGLDTGKIIPNADVIMQLRQFNAAAGCLSIAGNMISKTSFVFTLLRIVTGRLRWVLWFAMISMNLITVVQIICLLVQCQPISAAWDPRVIGTCWPLATILAVSVFTSAYSASMDIILSLLPWKVIWGLQMRTRERIGVCIAMSMGVLYVPDPIPLYHKILYTANIYLNSAGITGIVKSVYVARFDATDLSKIFLQ